MKSSRELYVDWFNNFLTVERFAEYHGLSVDEANSIIDRGRKQRKTMHKDRIRLLANDLYDHVFFTLDAEPEMTGEDAAIAARVTKYAFKKALETLLDDSSQDG